VSRRVLALGVVFLLLVTAAWWFFMLSPRNERIADLGDQYDAAVAEGDSLRLAVAALRDIQDNDVAFLAAIGQMEGGIPEEPELAVFIEEVTALAEGTGIDLQSISPTEPSSSVDLDLYEITVSLALKGEYFELLDFLFRLDDMERIVVVQTISVAPGTGGGEEAGPPEEESTTTTTPGTSTTVAGATTTTSSTTTTSTTTTSTTVPVLQENPLLVSLTLKIYTRTPLATAVLPASAPTAGSEENGSGTGSGDGASGEFGEEEFGIDSTEAPVNQAAGGSQ
jgi:Tfp pilus assembly protein PilO